MYIFIGIIALIIYGLLVYYIGRSVWSWMGPGKSALFKTLYIIVLTVVSTSFISGRFLGNLTVLNVIGALLDGGLLRADPRSPVVAFNDVGAAPNEAPPGRRGEEGRSARVGSLTAVDRAWYV